MAGFQSPNYTQVPNDLFDWMAEMSEAELRVTLVMVRQTFGWHRREFKMGINKIAAETGLSKNGAKAGIEAAEARGTFRRTNPGTQTEAEWELTVGQSVTQVGQPVTQEPPASDPQVGVKERVKKSTGAPDWDALLGTSVNQEITQRMQAMQAALNAFESALLFGTLPWDSTGPWQRLAKFVLQIHTEDPQAFEKYAEWRAGEGRYVAVSNSKIRQQPAMFIDTAWPEFLGRTQKASAAVDERPEYRPFVPPTTEGIIPAPRRSAK